MGIQSAEDKISKEQNSVLYAFFFYLKNTQNKPSGAEDTITLSTQTHHSRTRKFWAGNVMLKKATKIGQNATAQLKLFYYGCGE